MSSVSAACIFGAYNASSAHTDTFYIVPQIIRVRNSKRHFFSKLTFPYIIQPLRFTLRQHRPQPLRFTLRHHRPQPLRLTLRQHRPQPLRLTLRQHRPQPLRFTLRSHRPQPVISHNKAVLTALPKIFRIFLKKPLTNTRKPCIMFTVIWVWRRLVARYLGVVEAAGSNPVTQTS